MRLPQLNPRLTTSPQSLERRVGKILIADDEVGIRTVLGDTLMSQNYSAVTAGSGVEALEKLRTEDFDILLSDLMMPEMDGLELIQKALELDPYLVCIMMTGQGTVKTAVEAMKLGAFDYVLKPFRLETMMPVLTRAINTRHLLLENVQLREAVAIHELSQTIAFTLDPQTVLSKLADAALQQSGADEVSVLLPTTDGKELFVAAVRGNKRERLLGERIPFERSISGWVGSERTPLILNGAVDDERFVALWPRADIQSSVSVPMQVANKLIGILNLNLVEERRRFTMGQMKALTILAGTAAAALESASLYDQVRKAQDNYRSIFENSVEGIFQAPHYGGYMNANPAMARILGYDSPAELLEKVTNIAEQVFVHPEQCVEAVRRIEKNGRLKNFEVEVYRKDRSIIWLSMNLRSVSGDGKTDLYCEGTVEDITERKRAHAELRKLSLIVEKSRDFVGVATTDGAVNFINPAGRELVGLEPDADLTSMLLSDFVFEKDREPLMKKVLPKILRDGHWEGESTFYNFKTGTELPMWQHVFVVPNDDSDSPSSLATVCRDLTERKRAEETRQQQAEELKARNEELTRFNRATVGRELRLIELKQQVNELSELLGRPRPYPLAFLDDASTAIIEDVRNEQPIDSFDLSPTFEDKLL